MSRQCQTISSRNTRAAGGPGGAASTSFKGAGVEGKCAFLHPTASSLGGPELAPGPLGKVGCWGWKGEAGGQASQPRREAVLPSGGRGPHCSPCNAVSHLSNPLPQRRGDQKVTHPPTELSHSGHRRKVITARGLRRAMHSDCNEN